MDVQPTLGSSIRVLTRLFQVVLQPVTHAEREKQRVARRQLIALVHPHTVEGAYALLKASTFLLIPPGGEGASAAGAAAWAKIDVRERQLSALFPSANQRQIMHLAVEEACVLNLRDLYVQHGVTMPAVLADADGVARAVEELLGQQPMPDQPYRDASAAVVAFVTCLAVALGGEVDLLRQLARVGCESAELADDGDDDDDDDALVSSLPDNDAVAVAVAPGEDAQSCSQPRELPAAQSTAIAAAAAAAVLAAQRGPLQSTLSASFAGSGGTLRDLGCRAPARPSVIRASADPRRPIVPIPLSHCSSRLVRSARRSFGPRVVGVPVARLDELRVVLCRRTVRRVSARLPVLRPVPFPLGDLNKYIERLAGTVAGAWPTKHGSDKLTYLRQKWMAAPPAAVVSQPALPVDGASASCALVGGASASCASAGGAADGASASNSGKPQGEKGSPQCPLRTLRAQPAASGAGGGPVRPPPHQEVSRSEMTLSLSMRNSGHHHRLHPRCVTVTQYMSL